MSNYAQVDLRKIAGLSGIIPAWWISPADGKVSGTDAWASLRTQIESPGKGAGDLRWVPFENGEHYGIMPQKVWEEMGGPDHPRVFGAACILSPGPVDALYRFDVLSNYRLWVNGELVADRWEDDVPLLENGRAPVRLVEGLNGIVLEMPMRNFKERILFCGRVSGPDEKELDGIRSLAPGGGGDAAAGKGDFTRYFSPFEIFNRFVSREPSMRFEGDGPEDFKAWKAQFKAKLLELIGEFPAPVSLNPQVVERTSADGITCEKVLIQTQEEIYLPLHLLIPERNRDGQAIVAVHGHGGGAKFGKEQVSGATGGNRALQRQIWKLEYDYGRRFAQAGYITMTPDFRAFGERAETLPFSHHDDCAVNLFRYICYGENLLKYHIWDGMRAIDYLMSREEVNPDRVGLTGLSLGGRMTMFIGAVDERMKVCVPSGTMSSLRERKTMGRTCGSQTLPGLLTYGDATEIFGLIAPRPMLMQLGTNDATAPVFYAPEIDRDLRRIYACAGDESRYELDVYHSKHRYNFETALRWFRRWL